MSTGCDVRRTVGQVMITKPRTMAPDVTVGEVHAAFLNDHVHMVLLTESSVLVGTLVRADLHDASADQPARALAVLAGRTIGPSVPTEEATRALDAAGTRRLAVVDGDGVLLGLLCLKRRRNGFCGDHDLAARWRSRAHG